MSALLSNSTVLMQVVDEALRNDVHNSMILISTTLGVLLAGFTGAALVYRRHVLRLRNESKEDPTSSLTSVSVVSTSA